MPVFRVEKNNNYTTMCNYHLKDKDLSLKAKGLLSIMLSLPDSWKYSIKGLCSICKENETSIKSTLKELELNFYLIRNKKKNHLGRFEWEYIIYEIPQSNLPYIEKPPMDSLSVENIPHILSINTSNTKLINIKDIKDIKTFADANINFFFDYYKLIIDNNISIEKIEPKYINFLSNYIECYELSKDKIKLIIDYYSNEFKAENNKTINLLLTERVFLFILSKLGIIPPEEVFDETGNYNF